MGMASQWNARPPWGGRPKDTAGPRLWGRPVGASRSDAPGSVVPEGLVFSFPGRGDAPRLMFRIVDDLLEEVYKGVVGRGLLRRRRDDLG